MICIDEGTLIKGDESQRSKAIRGLQARNKLLATGTPISNYVNQIFWLMWWCLGDSSLRFPYSYDGGLAAFEADFCVVEYTYGRDGSDTAHRREKRKVLPQITNVSRFWRLSAAAMIRRRKPRLRRADRHLHPEDGQRRRWVSPSTSSTSTG